MQCYKIEITDLAEDDLESIGDYIAFQLEIPETAVNTMQGIRKEIQKLAWMPKRHELDEDLQLAGIGIRKQFYKNYKIFYTVDERKHSVIILRVLHMLADSKAMLYNTFRLE